MDGYNITFVQILGVSPFGYLLILARNWDPTKLLLWAQNWNADIQKCILNM